MSHLYYMLLSTSCFVALSMIIGVQQVNCFNVLTEIQFYCNLNTDTNILEHKLIKDMRSVLVCIKSFYYESLTDMRKLMQ